jgi:hypothetical protein
MSDKEGIDEVSMDIDFTYDGQVEVISDSISKILHEADQLSQYIERVTLIETNCFIKLSHLLSAYSNVNKIVVDAMEAGQQFDDWDEHKIK